LQNGLMVKVKESHEPLTLVIHADQRVSYNMLAHLSLLARDCGITNALLATLPSAETVKP